MSKDSNARKAGVAAYFKGLLTAKVNIGTILGIPISIHWSVAAFYLFTLIIGSDLGWYQYLLYPLVLYFVLLHELGHSIAAKKSNVEVKEILLMALGGAAVIKEINNPKKELIITIAGPAVNVVLIALSAASLAFSLGEDGGTWVGLILALNLVILVFNILPVYPMDGGRILNAILSLAMENKLKRTKVMKIMTPVLSLLIGFTLIYFHIYVGGLITLLAGIIGAATFFTEERAIQAEEEEEGNKALFEEAMEQLKLGTPFDSLNARQREAIEANISISDFLKYYRSTRLTQTSN